MNKKRGYGVSPTLTKDYILGVVSQEDIFRRYTGYNLIKPGKLFCSPIRNDDNPTCGYAYRQDGKLVLRDFAGHFWGDCFDLVQKMHYCDFQTAIETVARDFGVITREGNFNPSTVFVPENTPKPLLVSTKKEIRVKRRKWNKVDRAYWEPKRFTKAELQAAKIEPVDVLWMNDYIIYTYDPLDPAYVYHFGNKYDYKIYFPLRKSKFRFLCNTNKIQNYEHMPKHVKYIIWTKSYKDCVALRKYYPKYDIWALALQAESHYLTEKQYLVISERCDYMVSLYDFDATGVRMANWLYKTFGMPYFFFTNGRTFALDMIVETDDYGFKDFTEGLEIHDVPKMEILIWKAIQHHNKLIQYANSALPF